MVPVGILTVSIYDAPCVAWDGFVGRVRELNLGNGYFTFWVIHGAEGQICIASLLGSWHPEFFPTVAFRHGGGEIGSKHADTQAVAF